LGAKLDKLYFRKTGNKKHPAILFLHGFMGSSSDWNNVTEILSSDFLCISVDLPGHGKSCLTSNVSFYSLQKTAQYLIDIIQSEKLKECHLAGYSMGGRVALYLAVHFSGYFNKVIIESANPGIESEIERKQRLDHDYALAKKLETEDLDGFVNYWYEQPIFHSLKKHNNYANLLASRYNNDKMELAKSMRGLSIGNQTPLWDNLKTISNDCLLVAGEHDMKYVNILKSAQKKIISSELSIIKNSGHNTHFEQVIEFIKIIKEFLI